MAELPEGTQLVYVNWARVGGSPFEMNLDFGYNDEPGPPEKYPVRVVMSWEHAKGLAALLQENIEEYESQAGPIRNLFELGADDASD